MSRRVYAPGTGPFAGTRSCKLPKWWPEPRNPPHKEDCEGCRALVDSIGWYKPGYCGPDCLVRRYRFGRASREDGRWV